MKDFITFLLNTELLSILETLKTQEFCKISSQEKFFFAQTYIMKKAFVLFLSIFFTTICGADTLKYPIVETGQNGCYGDQGGIYCPTPNSDFYGQDAQYQGNLPDYLDNQDGTVTDKITGLMWQKKFKKVTWKDASKDSKKDKTAGYTDWRVPTIQELYSLMDFSGTTGTGMPHSTLPPTDAIPYINTKYFLFEYSPTGRYIDAQYITQTSYVSTTMQGIDSFFGVNFADGRIKGYPKSGTMNHKYFYARYVRGNPNYGKNDFYDNKDGSVTDKSTGLVWTKIDSGSPNFKKYTKHFKRKDGSLDWKEALYFCEKLHFAGKDDWRLPNAKELHSIVDYTRSPATTNSAAITPVFDSSHITDEGGKSNYPFYWSSTSHLDGIIPGASAVYVAFGDALGFMRGRFSHQLTLMDVHGAGAQRSDPKTGDPKDFPYGFGPQGDVRRIYNYARCVRSGNVTFNHKTDPPKKTQNNAPPGIVSGHYPPEPPREAQIACEVLKTGASCSFVSPHGKISGKCFLINGKNACVPKGHPH
ncbi:MAG: DUF1566 domain-containing protein [Leptospiraceae bacterium]|nr:DUF1566 domain-containing protein [Leptospiraceae bacterium]